MRNPLSLKRLAVSFGLILLLTGTAQAAEIDMGSPAINRPSGFGYDATMILVDNPADGTGTIDEVKIWAEEALVGCKVGTFYGSGTSYTNRDYASIGNVAAGSEQTFSSLNIAVTEGDFIGIWASSLGAVETHTSGYSGIYVKANDQFDAGEQTYTLYAGYTLSVYATGETEAPPAAGQVIIIGARDEENYHNPRLGIPLSMRE